MRRREASSGNELVPGNGPIPDWDHSGVIPALDEDNPTSRDRSPYIVSMRQLVERFGTTEHRRKLLGGLMDYRSDLRQAGLLQGFQWINGSFVEDVERTSSRPPEDIDVVTFYYVPDGYTDETFYAKNQTLLDPGSAKARHYVHAYYVRLNSGSVESVIRNCTYWYSLWSHSREGVWKGYLQMSLEVDEDGAARHDLDRIADESGQP